MRISGADSLVRVSGGFIARQYSLARAIAALVHPGVNLLNYFKNIYCLQKEYFKIYIVNIYAYKESILNKFIPYRIRLFFILYFFILCT